MGRNGVVGRMGLWAEWEQRISGEQSGGFDGGG